LKRLVLVLIALLLYVGGCTESEDCTVSTVPPTGPGISPSSRPADVQAQLVSMGFIGPEQNNTGKWLKPIDGTTAEIGPDQVTVTFQRTGGAVVCTIPADEHFGEVFMREEHEDRATLLEEHGCS